MEFRSPLDLSPYPMYNGCMIRTNVYLTRPEHEALQARSERSGLSVAEIIRRAIDQYLERETEKEKRDGQIPPPGL